MEMVASRYKRIDQSIPVIGKKKLCSTITICIVGAIFKSLQRSFPPSKTAEISMAVLLHNADQLYFVNFLKWRILKKALKKVSFAVRNIAVCNFCL